MKIDWNKKYTTIAVYAFIVLALYSLFNNLTIEADKTVGYINSLFGVFSPFIAGFALAYIINFILIFYQKVLFSKLGVYRRLSEKKQKAIALVSSYLTFILLAALILLKALPGAILSLKEIIESTPLYAQRVISVAEDLVKRLNIDPSLINEYTQKLNEIFKNLDSILSSIVPRLGSFLSQLASAFVNSFLALVISIYVLLEKEKFTGQSKMLLYAIFPVTFANTLINLTRRMHAITKRFFVSQGIDSLIVGIILFVVFSLMGIRHAGIMAFVIGFCNMIPWIGPILGTLPCTIIVLFQNQLLALWFLLAVVIVQQIDGNIIAPRIHGENLGISAFWILFSLVVSGKLFGIAGMLIGVPFFVLVYSIIKELTAKALSKKALPTTSGYYTAKDVVENTEGKIIKGTDK